MKLLRNALWVALFSLLAFADSVPAQTPSVPPAKAPAKTPTQAGAKPEAAKAAPLVVPELKFEKYKLDNGLEVILYEDHRLPLAAVDFVDHREARHRPSGREGVRLAVRR